MGTKEKPSEYNEYINTLLSVSKKRSVKKKINSVRKQCVVNSLALPAGTGTMKMLDIIINDDILQSLVDTGSTHSLLSVESFKLLGLTDYEPVNMSMKVAGSTLKNNIIGSTELTICLKTDGENLFTHKINFLIAHHINGYQAILGADFLLDPLHVMAITPYTIMLYEKDRTVCAPFICQRSINKTVLLHNSNSVFIPMDETVDLDVACACNTVLGELKKFTPLVTLLKKGILVKKVAANPESNSCTLTLQNVGPSHLELAKKQPIGYLDVSHDQEINDVPLVVPELSASCNSSKNRSFRGNSKRSNYSKSDIGKPDVDNLLDHYRTPDYTVDIEDDVIEQNVVVDPTNLDKKRSYKDCTVDPDLPERISVPLWELLKTNKSVFATSKLDVGKFKGFMVQIEIDKPIQAEKQRYMSPEKLDFCKKTFETFERLDLIRECHNPKTISNLLLVPKYEGLRDLTKASTYLAQVRGEKTYQFRIVQDLRRINQNTKNIKKSQPVLPESIFTRMQGKIVSSIDANQAYWHLVLDHASRPWTAFYLGKKLYQFNRMAQGLMNAPACWDEAMKIIFSPETMAKIKKLISKAKADQLPDSFDSFFTYYQDDSWIISDNIDIHLIHLEAVILAYKLHDIKISPDKCTFYAKTLKVLGVQVNPNQAELALDAVKAKSILTWEKPDSTYTLQSRLYSLNYWQKFIPQLSELKFPLQQIVRSGIFSWDAKADEAWERIKAIIALDIKLTIPRKDEQLILTCDASKVAISCILWVEQNDNLHVVGCYSKLFSHTDSLKSIHFKETYAMVEAFKHFRPYLLASSKSIIVFTDARSLMWVSRNREYSIACNGLVNKLAQIQLEIPHIVYSVPSEVNYLADLFSRAFQESRFLEKSHFSLSKVQANKIPPLTDPCVLTEGDLYFYFSTPIPSEDMDSHPRIKNKIATPRPIKNLYELFKQCTPEQKYYSALRLLKGWNDKNIMLDGGPALNTVEIIEQKNKEVYTLLCQKIVDITMEKLYSDLDKDQASRMRATLMENLKNMKVIGCKIRPDVR